MKIQNPIIKGFHPDPSICRVGDDFYLVNSTFQFFPGVPIYHSKNLVNWELISYCLTEDSQVPLQKCKSAGGIFAPTIRYYNGTFFMTTTNVTTGGNFIVHTNDISGKWSQPAYVAQKGIDPSIFFDDDGKVYYTSTYSCENIHGIQMCEINPFTGEQLTESKFIASQQIGKYPEGPHLYKFGDYYYLQIAEGGTEYGHMETIAKSKNPYGPYIGYPHNPILSHKDSMNYDIQATGHADLVDDQNGNYWCVFLGIRVIKGGGLHHNLGRETFIAPVTFEDGWYYVGQKGLVSLSIEVGDKLPAQPYEQKFDFYDDFSSDTLNLEWNYVTNPERERYTLSKKGLSIDGNGKTLEEYRPAFVGVKQFEFSTIATTKLTAIIEENQKAGLSAYLTNEHNLSIYVTCENGKHYIVVQKHCNDLCDRNNKFEIDYTGEIELKIESSPLLYKFSYKKDGQYCEVCSASSISVCSEVVLGNNFTGTYFGLFSEGTVATFEYFSQKEIK